MGILILPMPKVAFKVFSKEYLYLRKRMSILKPGKYLLIMFNSRDLIVLFNVLIAGVGNADKVECVECM